MTNFSLLAVLVFLCGVCPRLAAGSKPKPNENELTTGVAAEIPPVRSGGEITVLIAENNFLRNERDAFKVRSDKCEAAYMYSSFALPARKMPRTHSNVEEHHLVATGSDISVITSSLDISMVVGSPSYVTRHLSTRASGRRLESCGTPLLDTDAALISTGGWNVWTNDCSLGAEITVSGSGTRMKIKKASSVVGSLVLDRQANSANQGRHFLVQSGGALELEGLMLTHGFLTGDTSKYVSFCCCFGRKGLI